ncbi:MAG: CDP-diacylglycerol--glycerol-3-phosphate 3-phosphatidyltransferase [Alphaproteobacteria bacterium]|jgi:cardiolipin synthase|nr:CDP-diacylglycerol--glycerol-3-phosphate 3-phosphatidyltransferase [Alphaproteobacteria bacterium]MBO6627262.1 CDP-diacylglycerol--glycerol-3-phosphate 3-phosphatidyltransferase [Alphaproteobacteria bacterium]MDF1626560.1 CDP-diacylglycerol--glycerol-3-phosphate 3-phosphatidyltransferase [Parvibaculaceae bacterium]
MNHASPKKQTRGPVLTSLPNLLTYARIVMVPAMVAAFYLDGHLANWVTFGIFVAAAITDYFDGYFARAWEQTSNLGRMLDPIADKLLVSAALFMLVANGTIGWGSVIAGIIILSREILVSGLREFLAEVRVSVPVTQLAKWKTTIQMVAIGFLLVGNAGDNVLPGTLDIGIWLLWIAALLTLYTGYDYFRSGLRHVIKDDEDAAS